MPAPCRRPLARLAAALLLVAAAAAAWAAVVVRADVTRLAELADLVVDGTVQGRRVVHDAATGAIWTVHRLEIRRTLSGSAPEALDVHVPGGAVAGLEQDVAGAARMAAGERVVLFLERVAGRVQVLGEAQGCFRVEGDAAGRLVCRNDLEGLALVDTEGREVEAEPLRLTLAALERSVAAVVRAREEAEARRQAAIEARLERLRARAEETARRTRGKPGGAE